MRAIHYSAQIVYLDAVDREHDAVFRNASLQIIVSVSNTKSCGGERQAADPDQILTNAPAAMLTYKFMSSRVRIPDGRERTPSPALGDNPS